MDPSIGTLLFPGVAEGSLQPTIQQVEWKTFISQYEVISASDPEMEYQADVEKTSVHWGQRKLALAIVQFLSEHWNNQVVPNPTLLYIGASPGNNIEFVAKNFFPDFTVHLYDPRPMKVTPTDKMVVHQELFTDDIAKQWSGRNDVFLMSDIRSGDPSKEDRDTSEANIKNDMQLQGRIYEIVKPVRASLKFRLPYYYEDRPKYVDYLYGLVYRGIWPLRTSTETRLVPMENPDGFDRISWDILKYESQMFYHNVQVRQRMLFRNPMFPADDPRSETPVDGTELTNDYDSIAEAVVWGNYLRKVGGEDMVTVDNVRGLSRSLTQFLSEGRSKEKMTTLAKLRADPLFIKRRFG
jgi:Poly A polymerase regulatory subunit